MANRAIEQKRMKMRRAKRLFPKDYSADYIPVGRGPNREVMASLKERTRGLAFDQKYLDFLEETARFKNVPPGRVEAQKSAERLVSNPRELPDKDHMLSVALCEFPTAWARIKDVCPSLINIILENSMKRHVRLFYNEQRNRCIILELSHIGRYMRASMVYENVERAKRRFTDSQVRWVEFVSSSPPKPED